MPEEMVKKKVHCNEWSIPIIETSNVTKAELETREAEKVCLDETVTLRLRPKNQQQHLSLCSHLQSLMWPL